MDRYEQAALLDFVATVIWPTRTPSIVTDPAGQSTFDVFGTWDTNNDMAMAWVNGNRITSAITWVNQSRVTLPMTVAYGSQVIILVNPGAGAGYLPRNPAGSVSMLNDLLMGGHRIRDLGAAVEDGDAVRKDQVIAIVNTLVGGNFVAKAGDQMAGALLLMAATGLTDPAAAIRRDMAVLNDGTQEIQGKLLMAAGNSTVDGDDGRTLTTKDWVEAYVQAQLANTQAPNHELVFSTAGSGYSFTVGVDCANTVRKLWVYAKGGKGNKGGDNGYYTATTGGDGALGGIISGSLNVVPDAVLSIVVGGNGIAGTNTNNHDHKPSGGGGGGASQISVGSDALTGGGGGGGGAAGVRAPYTGAAGGAGGNAGGGSGSGWGGFPGGLPGNTIEDGGGVGGASGYNYANGRPGTVGGGVSTPAFNTSDNFPFQSVSDPNAVSGSGLVIIKWYEP